MAPTKRASRQSALVAISERNSIPELGDELLPVKKNKSGRPSRQSAGKRSLPSGFVNSDHAVANDGDDSADEDFVEEADEGLRVTSNKKRCLSRPARELSPALKEDCIDPSTTLARLNAVSANPQELTMTFHIPTGFEGPFIVKLDLSSIASHQLSPTSSAFPIVGLSPAPLHVNEPKTNGRISRCCRVAFLDLPAELRNIVYRHVLVSKDAISFHGHEGFSHCGALLSTCRQVSMEASQILYGENVFHFARDGRERGTYWSKWTEIGWKDVRRFFSAIGPVNIANLRKVGLTFDDPPPKRTDGFPFVDDDNVIEVLKMLATHGSLKELELAIHSRTIIKKTQVRFLRALERVKADSVKFVSSINGGYHRTYGTSGWRAHYYRREGRVANLDWGMDKGLVEKMERKNKFYRVD